VCHVRDIAAAHVAHVSSRSFTATWAGECDDLVSQPGGGERAVVMDFGLAKERRADAELLVTATDHPGHAEAHEPERPRRPLDPRTDVYSLR
jgi:hypothetical protein